MKGFFIQDKHESGKKAHYYWNCTKGGKRREMAGLVVELIAEGPWRGELAKEASDA